MGAWIETHEEVHCYGEDCVAPYMGAWIETPRTEMSESGNIVAPYMGAWIETSLQEHTIKTKQSHPIWVRGLKRHNRRQLICTQSRTLYGCVD